MDILLVALVALIGSLLSLVGALFLLLGGKRAEVMQRLAVPFAAGALLAAAFVDLLPEALEQGEADQVSIWMLFGILLFFVLERGLRWFHHHHAHENEENSSKSLIVIGDTIHNFIDGLAIGAAFLVNPATGIIATIAVATHEIPQEIGDFALLLSKGMKRRTALIINILSGLATVVAAVAVYLIGGAIELPLAAMLAITAGFFVYIAVSDIIPTIHAETNAKAANIQTLILLSAVLIVSFMTSQTHQFIPEESHGEQSSAHEEDSHENE
ncbi:ZIP zinc transporter [Candidatus Saccharibacteria bacterium]|nr:MAG: ZIP zinc transporter [Candidatus Saccharibacteria bacterium]